MSTPVSPDNSLHKASNGSLPRPAYPLFFIAQKYAEVHTRLTQTLAWLEGCDCPTPESDDLRHWYLAILRRWAQVTPEGPPPALVAAYTAEYQQLAAMLAQPERRAVHGKRAAVAVPTAAD
jgi:hypothetical protein